MKGFEAIDGLEPALNLLVHTLDEIRGSRTFRTEPGLCFHIGSEFFCMFEDALHGGNLQRITTMLRRSPPDASLEALLTEEGDAEDMFFDVFEETVVVLAGSDPQVTANVFEEMDMAELDEDIGEDVPGCHANGFMVIAGDRDERVIYVLQLREVLHPGFKTLRGRKEADGDVMGSVIDAVEEGNLLLVAPHSDVLPVHDDLSSETFPVAVVSRDIIVVRQCIEFLNEACVCPIEALPYSRCEGTDACAFEVKIEEGFLLLPTMIDAEVPMTIIAVVPIHTPSGSFPTRTKTAAEFACTVASMSLFLGMNMLEGEKSASVCRKHQKSGAQKETLSKRGMGENIRHIRFLSGCRR